MTRRRVLDTESKPGDLLGALGHLQHVGNAENGGCGGI